MNLPAPYYSEPGVTIYHGDCRDILPNLDPGHVIITDPIWPDCEKIFPGIDAYKLFAEASVHFPRLCERAVIILGCDSDPRILEGIPKSLAYFRTCWMRIVPPRYRGTILSGADVAYIFGARWLNPEAGHIRVIPGEMTGQFDPNTPTIEDHPCPRNTRHMEWLVGNYSRVNQTIIDPFMGSNTIGVAVKGSGGGRNFIGIEKEEKYCEVAVRRIRQGIFNFSTKK